MSALDKITGQIIRSSLLYASEEMGIALRNAAYSPNIKDRMDHSAAIFDSEGRLLAQAEHIPVHLGSLPWGLRKLVSASRKEGLPFEEGSMIVANNPYITGTHLNDVTVVAPIYYKDKRVGFTANKAHHSDIGGSVPGSINMDSKTLFEEGLVMDHEYLMREGEFVADLLTVFSSHSRMPQERLGDLKAQAAANITGTRRVNKIISKYGLASFKEAATEAFHYSESLTRRRIASLNRGTFVVEDYLELPDEHDVKLKAKLTIAEQGIEIDYKGTAQQLDCPLNAVFGVTLSGVYFVVRTLIGDDIPANHGAFAPISVLAPEGTIVNPTFPHPVGGGNVETGQRNADLVFNAFSKAVPDKVPAASGGSMNNVMIGGIQNGKSWAFYETIAVGLGGRKGMDGIDGIHSNMTNTMNTPIEEIERNTPMLITRYEYRVDSSGAGKYRGGCGVVRAYRMRSDSTIFTVLAGRERHGPWGLFGGAEGEKTQVILQRNNKQQRTSTKTTLQLKKEDEIQIHTAGGGGYGSAKQRNKEKIKEDISNGLITNFYAKKFYSI
ncbi:MAG: hydantoinase B/oxoprolinase family protein [Candidatus Bathyarchaeota archaeon]|nr:hydantoinase B/oxoprolinase family protein [Candidatus Bathyarchaeota archaeon]